MKILLFHPWLKSKGGGERLVYEYFRRSKHKIKIMTWIYIREKTYDFGEKNVISLYDKKFEGIFRQYLVRGGLLFLDRLIRRFNIDDFDLLLISTAGIAELLLFNQNFNIPKVLYSHSILRASYKYDIYWNLKYRIPNIEVLPYKVALNVYNFLEKRMWKKIDFAIFNSELSRKRALDKNLIDINKTDVIYPGVDIQNIYNDNPEDYFLYVARFALPKRQHILVKSFAKFIKKYPEYKLYLVGGIENNKYYLKILRLIKEYNLQSNVKIFINVSDEKLRELYAKSLACAYIPYMEDYGIVPFEAMSAGKYLINVYPAGSYELLKNAPGIYWIKEKFYEESMTDEIYKALEYFVKNKDELLEKGKENRNYIKNIDISWDSFTKKLDNKLKDILEKYK
ncbi:Glycosyltransferase [Candidatus Nanobsidianus stetteri]|uniref:Glycosyltransferase n=1 Tax=Nanobsidianus stetteri TaxID=1294122 RepID=R1FT11_NANST|nr:Glycosyltransferase [Candidatus Nanobsidianus stetteri]